MNTHTDTATHYETESHTAAAAVAALASTALEAAQLHVRNFEMVASNCAARFAIGDLDARDLEALELYAREIGTWLGAPAQVMNEAVRLHTAAAEHAATSHTGGPDANHFHG